MEETVYGVDWDELRKFIHDVTLHLQEQQPQDARHRMFQRAYRLYVKYEVE